jgi:hypothetical protein
MLVISRGTELPLEREIVAVAVWPIETAPKAIEFGEAIRVPFSLPFITYVPQPDRARRRLKATAIARQRRVSWCWSLDIRNLQ